MAAVGQHGELDAVGAPVVEQGVDRGARGPAGVEDVVDEHDAVVLEPEGQVGAVHDGVGGSRREVVAVEGDVDVPERDSLLEEVR